PGRHGQRAGNDGRGHRYRTRRKSRGDIHRGDMGARRGLRRAAGDACPAPERHFRDCPMSGWRFIAGALAVLAIAALLPRVVTNAFVFYVGFVMLQYVVIATGWNILGGYAGYVNFGSGAFVGLGAYTAVFLFHAIGASLWLQIAAAAAVGGVL